MAKRTQHLSEAERQRRRRQARINFGLSNKTKRSVTHMGKGKHHRRHSSNGRMGGFGEIAKNAGLGVAVGAGTQLVAQKLPVISGFAPFIALWTSYKAGGTAGAIAYAVTSGVLNTAFSGGLGGLLSGATSTSTSSMTPTF